MTVLSSTLAATALAAAGPAAAQPGPPQSGPLQPVLVQATDAGSAERAVERAGGTVTHTLPIIDGVAAKVPANRLDAVRRAAGVRAVSPDGTVKLLGRTPTGGSSGTLGYDPVANFGSLYNTAKLIGAHESYKAGYTGKGIGIAMIDSGVSPVQGLTSGNVTNGPDLSFESQDANTTNKDTFGHGTHMASIMVGRDVAQTNPGAYIDSSRFVGIAPDAHLVSLKMAAHDGAVDISQIIAAVNWVTQHAKDPALNIRVLNLSFGTDGVQDYQLDPLSYAVEQAWHKGIVVVAAAGNDGTSKVDLANPALNPHVLAVGAENPNGTYAVSDDTLPSFSNRGTARRKVNVVAPGVSILGLRNPNGSLDLTYPSARTGDRFFRGSGTSQAAAVVSGATALLLQRYPTITPNQVKALLESTAQPLSDTQPNAGHGLVAVRRAQLATSPTDVTRYNFAKGSGLGTLEGARGSAHVADCASGTCVDLVGELDIMNKAWKPAEWTPKVANNTTWEGDGSWNGTVWSGTGWDGVSWTGRTWTGRTWTGTSWTGRTWTGRTWTGRTWTSTGWSDGTWSGRTWTGRTWTGSAWAGGSWS